jgi:L-alanine-DL-glutamate epimerase-like enolase superfamily enzyme
MRRARRSTSADRHTCCTANGHGWITNEPRWAAGSGKLGAMSAAPASVRVRDVELRVLPCPSRLPFRFGAATITFAPLVTTRVTLDDGATGYAADLMMPRWFDKDPAKTVRDDITALGQSTQAAARAFAAQPSGTVFQTWWAAYQACQNSRGIPLVQGFGVALVERALMDATCRSAGVPFFEALRTDIFGFQPSIADPQLRTWTLDCALPGELPERMQVRHTIGMLDPLRRSDIADDARVEDNFPQALEDDIARYGLRAFKVKVGGDPIADTARLKQLAQVIPEFAGADFLVTLDGNEQYLDPNALADVLDEVHGAPGGDAFLKRTLWIEQPLPRATSFDPAHADAIRRLSEYASVIIDEADAGTHAFRRALANGHEGISMKNCKGVFRALLNRGVCDTVGEGHFLAGEDLTNLPILSVQQDLLTAASLDLRHVERNGHHYFRGLDHLPKDEAESALSAHPELYERQADGGIALKVTEGSVDLTSINGVGYGYNAQIDFEARTPLADWSIPEGL